MSKPQSREAVRRTTTLVAEQAFAPKTTSKRSRQASTITRSNANWPKLRAQLALAGKLAEVAAERLETSERRFLALAPARRKPFPPWYRNARQSEARAARTWDKVCTQIADTPASQKEDIRTKATLLALIYGLDISTLEEGGRKDSDLVARMIGSILADLA